MKCFECGKEASSKVGESQGSIWRALIGRRCWLKKEIYLCRNCYEKAKQSYPAKNKGDI